MRDVSGELLSERQRNGVLQMSASDFDDRHELVAFCPKLREEETECGEQFADGHFRRRDVHCRGEGVVGGLRHVHMVIRVHGLFAAFFAAEQFVGAV